MEKGFFLNRRLDVSCKGGRLLMDRKTELRSWRLKLAIELTDSDAEAAGGAILSNYRQIRMRSNAVEKIEIGGSFLVVAEFFGDKLPNAKKLLRLDKCTVEEFALSHEDETTEFCLSLSHENTDKLHSFVKDYAFTRFSVMFQLKQRTFEEALDEELEEKKQRLQEAADETGITTTLFDPEGEKLAEFKPRGKAS